MTHVPSDAFTPLGPPLIPGFAHHDCKAVVIIPARNEEAALPNALEALRLQRDLANAPLACNSYEVVVLLNNCSDSSLEVAQQFQSQHPSFRLHVAVHTLPVEQAHVGTARRLLMDTAYSRLGRSVMFTTAILSTDADSVVACDWIARNLAALHAGADVVGGAIQLFPEELQELKENDTSVFAAYEHDAQLQRLVAHLEAILDPDPVDPMPRHLHHFGASLACTPEIYARAGGLPPITPLEDVAFIQALRRIGAKIRHSPDVKVHTSARLAGRTEIGLSGQLKCWHDEARKGDPQMVDSAAWLAHRFRSMQKLREICQAACLPEDLRYPAPWLDRLKELHARHLPVPQFLEQLNCDALIEELFLAYETPRRGEITQVVTELTGMIDASTAPAG